MIFFSGEDIIIGVKTEWLIVRLRPNKAVIQNFSGNPYFRLIFPQKSKKESSSLVRKGLYIRIFSLFSAFALLATVFSVFPKPAEAGIVSFLSELFSKKEDPHSIQNSQTIPLLHAVLNTDLNSSKGGGDINIVDDNALLPESGPLGTVANIEETRIKDTISIYVVREGDSLSSISKLFDVSVNTIRWANNLNKNSSIAPGDTLVILPVSGVKYVVRKGDTLSSIAKSLKADVDEIAQFNDLSVSTKLSAGDTLIVPNGEIAPSTNSSGSIKSSIASKKTSTPSYVGYYIRPVEGGVKSQGLHGHNGVDLANSCGTPILASASGSVVLARTSGWNAGYGIYTVVDHSNGTQTLYSHLSKLLVTSGQKVVQGEVIGYMGTSGKSTGCHLHFEIRGAKNPF